VTPFDFVAWARDVVERKAARMAWCRLMPPVLERALAQALADRSVDVDYVIKLGAELRWCDDELHIEHRGRT